MSAKEKRRRGTKQFHVRYETRDCSRLPFTTVILGLPSTLTFDIMMASVGNVKRAAWFAGKAGQLAGREYDWQEYEFFIGGCSVSVLMLEVEQ